jgi:hypothetical protein
MPTRPNLYARIEDVRRIAPPQEAADGSGRLIAERGFAERLAEAEIAIQALEMIELQVCPTSARGRNPGAASSQMKIRGSETLQALDHLGVEALAWYAAPFVAGSAPARHNEADGHAGYGLTAMPLYLNNRAATIYAGSNEIQRNIIAKATLAPVERTGRAAQRRPGRRARRVAFHPDAMPGPAADYHGLRAALLGPSPDRARAALGRRVSACPACRWSLQRRIVNDAIKNGATETISGWRSPMPASRCSSRA